MPQLALLKAKAESIPPPRAVRLRLTRRRTPRVDTRGAEGTEWREVEPGLTVKFAYDGEYALPNAEEGAADDYELELHYRSPQIADTLLGRAAISDGLMHSADGRTDDLRLYEADGPGGKGALIGTVVVKITPGGSADPPRKWDPGATAQPPEAKPTQTLTPTPMPAASAPADAKWAAELDRLKAAAAARPSAPPAAPPVASSTNSSATSGGGAESRRPAAARAECDAAEARLDDVRAQVSAARDELEKAYAELDGLRGMPVPSAAKMRRKRDEEMRALMHVRAEIGAAAARRDELLRERRRGRGTSQS